MVLCKNLVTLVQWAGGSVNGYRSMFLRLDDVHNLSLLGRLTSVAVPALVQASKQRVDAGLRVLDVFVRGLPDLPAHLPRRSLALYVGLIRGLAQVVTPTPVCVVTADLHTASPGVGRRVTKQVALQSWLWTAAAFFLNTDWPSHETGAHTHFHISLPFFTCVLFKDKFSVASLKSALAFILLICVQNIYFSNE